MKITQKVFRDIAENTQFWLEDPRTSDVEIFIKIKPVKRSKQRPFDCNAKSKYAWATVKRGYFVEDTIVFIEVETKTNASTVL
jgi:hypothetical protein